MDSSEIAISSISGIDDTGIGELPRKKLINLIFANYSTLNGIQSSADIPLAPVQPMLEKSLLIPDHTLYILSSPLIQEPLILRWQRNRW